MYRLAFAAALLLASPSQGGTVTQDDWSGGPGKPGPVGSWNDSFDTDVHIDYLTGEPELVHALSHRISAGRFWGYDCVFPTDVDGDGDLDVIAISSEEDDVMLYRNLDGAGYVWEEVIICLDVEGVNFGDAADADGDLDNDVFVSVGDPDGDVLWFENQDGQGGSWQEHLISGSAYGADRLVAADIDGDGYTDAVVSSSLGYYLKWWRNDDGTGTAWSEYTIEPFFGFARCLQVHDVDGDGDPDVLASTLYNGVVAWYENNGVPSLWPTHPIYCSWFYLFWIAPGDLDGDGDTDLAEACYYDGLNWVENADGAGTSWVEHVIDADSYASDIEVTDMNGDGLDDIVMGSYAMVQTFLYENSPSSPGSSWTKHMLSDGYGWLGDLDVDDIDGDGTPDMLASFYGYSPEYHDVFWWDLTSYARDGRLDSSILGVFGVGSWDQFHRTATIPAGTSLGIQFRSSNMPMNMGPWSDTLFCADTSLVGILAPNTEYIQYRVTMTSSGDATPVMESISVDWSYAPGVGDGYVALGSPPSLRPIENPSRGGCCSFEVGIPAAARVRLTLYDLCGRVAGEYDGDMIRGTSVRGFEVLESGIYFCTMESEGFTATVRVVVLD
jgi:hypothetical protein